MCGRHTSLRERTWGDRLMPAAAPPPAEFIWNNGEFVRWADATVHVMTHALHYGTSIFEGIRCYDTPQGPAVFRLFEHIARLCDSARIYGFPLPFDEAALVDACLQTLRANGLRAAYIRPIAFLGQCGIAPAPLPEQMKVDMVVAAFPWAGHLDAAAQETGIDVGVSSWARLAPNTIPPMAKAGGNYLSTYLIGREARRHGMAEGIGLGADGRLSEGAAENLFLVKDGRLMTPPSASSILVGVTRDTVVQLAGDLGIEVIEQPLPREALYVADEVFLTGTACEIMAVRSVDGIGTKAGGAGAITRRLQSAFRGLFSGETPDRRGWLTQVDDLARMRALN